MNDNIQNQIEDEEEIDLLELAFELLAHIKFILAVSILVAVITAAINYFLLVPVYESTAELYMLDNSTSISSLADIQIGNNLATDYVEVTSSRPVLDAVIENLELEEDFESLSNKLTVKNDSNTHILKISVRDQNASRAKMIADEIAKVSKSFIADKMGQKEPSVLHYGYADGKKVSPRRTRNTLIAFAGGFAFSSAIVIISFLLNDTIKIEEDVEKKIGLTVLGSIPYDEAMNPENKATKKKRKNRVKEDNEKSNN